jgi:hypothetical protein
MVSRNPRRSPQTPPLGACSIRTGSLELQLCVLAPLRLCVKLPCLSEHVTGRLLTRKLEMNALSNQLPLSPAAARAQPGGGGSAGGQAQRWSCAAGGPGHRGHGSCATGRQRRVWPSRPMSRPEDVRRWSRRPRAGGTVDLSSTTPPSAAAVHAHGPDEWRRIMAVNLDEPFAHACHAQTAGADREHQQSG